MGVSEEIYKQFFAKLLEDSTFKKSFIARLRKLADEGQINQETLRTLIEAQDSNESKN